MAPAITRVEVIEFEFERRDVRADPDSFVFMYAPGERQAARARAIRLHTDLGLIGDFVGGTAAEYSAVPILAQALLGRSALERERVYNNAKRSLRAQARLGVGVVDMALWDLAGKYYEAPIYELLGAAPRRLPCYASTFVADRAPGGLQDASAFADFAEQCYELGYRAFKMHPWVDASVEEVIEVVRRVRERVGERMVLMLDLFSSLATFADAVRVGRACDDFGYLWLEDPFRDGGNSAQAHRKLRQLIRTPLLQLEHVRGLESHVDWIVAEATDFVRADPEYDGGITGVMKIAHAAEGFGLDVELHGPDPFRRHLMTGILNTNYYEMGLVHPKIATHLPPIYTGDYADDLMAVGSDGCVAVPSGPGAGIEYDWGFVDKHAVARAEFKP